MKNLPSLVVSTALSLAILACGGPAEPTASSTPRFVYVSPDPLGINPFRIMGQTGIEQAAAKHGAEAVILESEDPTTRAENVRAAVDEGATLVVVLGFEFNDIIAEVAAENPKIEFVIVDQCIESPPDNVHCAVFREFEASFLIGAIAASMTETGHVGVVGTADIPFLHRYTEGFEAGARHIREDIQVSIRWVGGENPFADPVRAKEQALDLAANDADHIFAASAAGNLGIFEAAREEDIRAFGLDVDQCPAAPGFIVDNLIKRVDLVIEQVADAILKGTAEPMMVFGLGSGGLYLNALSRDIDPASECLIYQYPEVMKSMRAVADLIVAGEIGIEDPMGLL
jgi:basic membrane protein A